MPCFAKREHIIWKEDILVALLMPSLILYPENSVSSGKLIKSVPNCKLSVKKVCYMRNSFYDGNVSFNQQLLK